MRKLIVAILLVWAILATVVAYQQYQNINKLEKEIVSLKWQVYSNKTAIKELKSEKETLGKKIQDLESENWRLIQQIDKLRKENEELRNQVSELLVKISELEDKLRLYEQVPHGYYSTNFFPEGVSGRYQRIHHPWASSDSGIHLLKPRSPCTLTRHIPIHPTIY